MYIYIYMYIYVYVWVDVSMYVAMYLEGIKLYAYIFSIAHHSFLLVLRNIVIAFVNTSEIFHNSISLLNVTTEFPGEGRLELIYVPAYKKLYEASAFLFALHIFLPLW